MLIQKKMNDLPSEQDVKALEVYLRLSKRPESYEVQRDLNGLMHWLDITSNGFALRLRKAYPGLTVYELNLCCLLRLGYSWEEVGEVMKVKDTTVRRYIYRICKRLTIPGHKKGFEHFISSF